MVFSSPTFLFLFLPVVLIVTLTQRTRAQNFLLLLASLTFYAYGEPKIFGVFLASIGANYAVGLALGRTSSKRARTFVLATGLVLNLALLGYYKYANFFVDQVNAVLAALGSSGVHVAEIALPIGISFFTFQAMSYLIDVYRGHAPVQRDPISFALYIALFPQLIAGPIVRYTQVAKDLLERDPQLHDVTAGLSRFILGLAKKVLLANALSEPADAIFGLPTNELTAPLAFTGILCYSLQIYFDFSGYSDMAIGLGRAFGFAFPENFNYPYFSQSITEFWRRWHLSLSSWFRDYLYIPLGGNRGGALATYRNLVIVFLLCGLWHGDSWTFVVWGAWHGALLVSERLFLSRLIFGLPRPLRHAYLLVMVTIGWTFFRADTLDHALAFLQALVGFGQGSGLTEFASRHWDHELVLVALVGLVGSVPWFQRVTTALSWQAPGRLRGRKGVAFLALHALSLLSLLGVLGLCAAQLAGGTSNPFIYFRF